LVPRIRMLQGDRVTIPAKRQSRGEFLRSIV
jgi:hypothetical protein